MRVFKILFLLMFLLSFSSCKKEVNGSQEKQSVQKKSTKSENVFILKDSLAVANLEGKKVYRSIWLYLPPNYKASEKRYPVIYMHDGQNLFDKETSYAGEWGVDEILNDVFHKTGRGFIVVGINNVGDERMNEYSPWKHEKYGGGNGDNYLEAIVSVLKPKIDAEYRTKSSQEYTSTMGSSMGGLISYYAGLKYPDVFGKIGVFSPSFWFSESVIDYTKEKAADSKTKMFFVLGDKEGMTKEFNNVSSVLLKSGFSTNNFTKKLVPGGEHNEAFWNSQFKEVVIWLYNIKE